MRISNHEKEELLKELLRPEASDNAGFAVVGVGTLVAGAIYGGASITSVSTAAIGTVVVIAGFAGPVLLVVGLGGMVYLTIRRLTKKPPVDAGRKEKMGA